MLSKDKYILVVDDIQPARETIINILKVIGFKNILEAANGEEAIEMLKKYKIDVQLVISDWKMPKLTGLDLLRWLRKQEDLKDILFIFTTSKGEAEDIALAVEEGIDGYLIKPVTIESLIKKIEQLKKGSNTSCVLKEYENRVAELIKDNRLEDAVKMLEKVMLEHPKFKPRLAFEIAKIYKQLNQLDKAKEYLKEALKENSLMLKAWTMLTDIYLIEKDYNAAEISLKNILEINPSSIKNNFLLGKVYLLKNEFAKAKDYFTISLNLDPNNIDLKQDIWNTYLDLGLREQVIKDFGPMLYDMLTVDTLNNLAVSFSKEGKIEDAIKVYKQALKKDPDNEKIIYNVAIAYMKQGNNNFALKYLKKALECNPDFEPAKELWSKITS
ncbi:MAG: tetratricopeptide repeat protein [Desulfonauticus sp.]|nr:tetratricopeptide repeat protein [Desulfonauticus sp.]